MKLNGMTDNRYKVNEQDILDMREFRSLGFTLQQIADSYNISTTTVVYWTNDKSRAKQRLKNAKKKTRKEDMSKKIERDLAKRKQNLKETPRTFMRAKLENRLNDKRVPNKKVKTMYGMPVEKVKELKEKELLYRGNSKVSL